MQQNRSYTSYYCEENAYKLCEELLSQHNRELYIVFISNHERKVPIFMQEIAQPGNVVIWDYHVICVELSGEEGVVYDLASLLPCPCSLQEYARLGLRPAESLPVERRFRVVPAPMYLRHFASDRSHMWDQRGVPGWSAPPPKHAPIIAADGTTMNLERYWSMEEDATEDDGRYGSVLNEAEFLALFGAGTVHRRHGAGLSAEGVASAALS